jgi:uncharacterized membrane protein YgcG
MNLIARVVAALLPCIAGPAAADERILDFHGDIVVAADAGMQVTETIRVRTEADRIRRGIYRDFPTVYRDGAGNRVRVEFEAEAVTRDGNAEAFHVESRGNGVRVYFGSESVLLEPGEYTYALRYRTRRQIGFFETHDELYWNVTGNGWDFPIDAASAQVTLPPGVAAGDMRIEGYTGPQGSKGQDYVATVDGDARASIRATRMLAPQEGLTVVVSFPKGIVAAPSDAQRLDWFLQDNSAVLVGGGGLALLWLYYVLQWLRVGRDPRAGVVVPEYDAPSGVTPGALRHIERMGYDDRCFAADLVDLARQGALTIRERDGGYSLQRDSRGSGSWPAAQRVLLDGVFAGGSVLELKKGEHRRVAAARDAHRKVLDSENTGRYFNVNAGVGVIGILIAMVSLGVGVWTLGSGGQRAGGLFLLVWLGGWSVGVFTLVAGVIRAWRSGRGVLGYGSALFLTLFSLPFVAGEIAGFAMFAKLVGLGFALVLLAMVATNLLFSRWMKAPTVEGRKLLDRIAGLRLYLGVAEREDLATRNAPPMTADEFQRLLPHALALDVERTWADRLAAAVGPAAAAAAVGSAAWYSGSSAVSNITGFADGIGSSLSNAISSSSTAPGSSSGGGGGGSSGGGGGGGGGGGW